MSSSTPRLRRVQMSDVWRLVHLARIARHGGYPLRMPSDFPRTLRVALFRATTSACVDALDHDARWERFSPTFNMCAASPRFPLHEVAAELPSLCDIESPGFFMVVLLQHKCRQLRP